MRTTELMEEVECPDRRPLIRWETHTGRYVDDPHGWHSRSFADTEAEEAGLLGGPRPRAPSRPSRALGTPDLTVGAVSAGGPPGRLGSSGLSDTPPVRRLA